MELYPLNLSPSSFEEATFHFSRLVERLGSPETTALAHDELEKMIRTDGFEVLRLLLQGHLDARHAAEKREPMEGDNGVLRIPLRTRSRRLVTVFGEVEVNRTVLAAPGHDSLMPLDAELNLSSGSFSFGVVRLVAEESSRGSYVETIDAIDRTTGAHVAKRQAEELTQQASTDFDEFYETRAVVPPAADDNIIVVSVDGKGVVVRTEDLREPTRKAAEKGKHKLEKRLSRGEKRNRKRMATVAAVYSIAPNPRTPEEVINESQKLDSEKETPRPKDKRVWASLVKSTADVIGDAFDEAMARDPEHLHPLVVLVDGNAHQIEKVRETARRLGVELYLILDIIHVIEYLWKAVWCLFGHGDPKAEEWVTVHLLSILQGKATDVAAGIRRSATLRELSTSAREPMDTCADYILDHKDLMHYERYLQQGFPIATGVIEGACRHLIKDRMDITGARWSLAGAEAVLRLRSLRSSGDFEEYWAFHLKAELQRNHLARYATHDFIELRRAA